MSGVDNRSSWVRLIIIFAIASVGNVGMWSIVTVMPTIELEFLLDRSQASLPYTTTMIGFAIGNWIFGRFGGRDFLAQKVGPKIIFGPTSWAKYSFWYFLEKYHSELV